MPSRSRQAARALASSGSATLGSPQTRRASSRPEGDPHVVGRGREHLGRPAHRMIEVHPLVPDRVPDGVGDGLDVAMPGVDEHHVEVAVGAERAPPVPPDGQKGQVAVGFSDGPVGQTGEPFVRLGGVGPAEGVALEVGPGQEGAAPFPE